MAISDYILFDGNVGLRPVADSDVDFIWRLELEPREYNENNIRPRSVVARSMENGEFWSEERKTFIVELSQDEPAIPVGKIGLKFKKKITRECEVGTAITAAYRGLGVGTRAKMLLADYAFRAYPLARVFAATMVENAPAIRSLEKCGFAIEGVARSIRFVRGKYRDYAGYSLLRDEYKNARPGWKLSGNSDRIDPRAVAESELPQYRITGNLIAIRPTELTDGVFLSNLWSQPYPYLNHEICSVDDYNKWYADGDFWGERNRTFIIETLDGKPLGQVGMWAYDARNSEAEVGTLLVEDGDRGKGYGTEAKLLAMEYGFDVWPINRIYAGTNQYNRAARCSLSRAGLRLESVGSGVEEGRRTPSGAALYGVSREEWFNAREVPDA